MYKTPVPLTKDRHGALRLTAVTDYRFAAKISAVPIYLPEAMVAGVEFPIAFVRDGDGVLPTALMGLVPGQNLFVGPDGAWLANYVPANIRRYPFVLGRSEGSSDLVLCIDEGSGLLSEMVGDPLFGSAQQPTEVVTRAGRLCGELEAARSTTQRATAMLDAAGLIKSWPLRVKRETGEEEVGGLLRVDGPDLDALPDDVFLSLRASGALSLVYAHLMSISNLRTLARMAVRPVPTAPTPIAAPAPQPAAPQRVPVEDLVFRF